VDQKFDKILKELSNLKQAVKLNKRAVWKLTVLLVG
jgi:hypothetical protein